MKSIKINSLATLLAISVIGAMPNSAWAKKQEQVKIEVDKVTATVISGRLDPKSSTRVNMKVHRSQDGACTKVKYVRVVTGSDPRAPKTDELAYKKVGSGSRGLCNVGEAFTVQPFSDAELVGLCRNATGTKAKAKDGLVSFWDTEPSNMHSVQTGTKRVCKERQQCTDRYGNKYCVDNYDCKNGQQTSCTPVCHDEPVYETVPCPGNKMCSGYLIKTKKNGKQKANHPVRFIANVRCETRTVPQAHAYNMQGWWKLTAVGDPMNGEWSFTPTSPTARARQITYSTRGPATNRTGIIDYGKGTGSARVKVFGNGRNTFTWTRNDKVSCQGGLNSAHTVITGKCQKKGLSKRYSFKLERSQGPQRIRVNKPNVGIQKNPLIDPSRTQPKPRPPVPPRP